MVLLVQTSYVTYFVGRRSPWQAELTKRVRGQAVHRPPRRSTTAPGLFAMIRPERSTSGYLLRGPLPTPPAQIRLESGSDVPPVVHSHASWPALTTLAIPQKNSRHEGPLHITDLECQTQGATPPAGPLAGGIESLEFFMD